jgi:hypothetical protein
LFASLDGVPLVLTGALTDRFARRNSSFQRTACSLNWVIGDWAEDDTVAVVLDRHTLRSPPSSNACRQRQLTGARHFE